MATNKGEIAQLSFKLAISIIDLYRHLIKHEKEYVMSKQLLRSGTSVGALVREAQNAESTADFIHKLAIAQKECAETQYWLELMKTSGYMDLTRYEQLYSVSCSILNMIRSAILSTKKRNNRSRKKPITHNP